MWSEIMKRCRHLLAMRWLSRSSSAAVQQPAAESSRPSQSPVPDYRRRQKPPDDLTVIKGIGPVMRDRRRILGIATFADLAHADPAELARQLRRHQPVSDDYVQSWVRAARERTGT
jgi:predicted flap endonuclease-1-like 5' DNA nuclease